MDFRVHKHRRFLATIGGVALPACGVVPLLRTARLAEMPAGAMEGTAAAEGGPSLIGELEQARAWIARLRLQQIDVLGGPISRLQREFRLGYRRAGALAQHLEQYGEWSVFVDEAGWRHARFHPLPR